ncbi:FAD-dependent oxidoreductase [Ferribacterium limneticum]|uniref:FAD-dependent oxidoreductase n=1 Tax=Ferribacterium limneticum TaxID=76259 RepID=UPI001CFAB1B8|nr:FAD/NAD(P)-binding oxidoreductase [Ferribacterium limneticum]UCV27276.1 NAD(P)/FAD-dependent oxidoreductase [Ferribacterium limneticum]UCV31193.1 NAD(P)/FAD-dependent oxidoreductase [Ferribacterium limneticum]
MKTTRRQFLLAAGLLPLIGSSRAASRRVVVIGGGWGGLSTARHLRALAPDIEVVLIDRQPAFVSFALSNRWLVDATVPAPERHEYAALAARWGYRFVQADVSAIDRAAGIVIAGNERLAYDWLVIAPGIRENYAAWQVEDPALVAELRRRYSGAMLNGADLLSLKQRLAGFKGGDLLMNIPPAPYRCPPAPYERAMLIAWWLKTQKIPGKLIIADPNPMMPAFRSILLDRFKDQVTYLDHAQIRQIDPVRKTVSTDIDDIRFDAALLSPPQQAADLIWQAGLIRAEEGGRPSGWAAQGAVDFRSPVDERVFVIGDATGMVSPAFGLYPKTGHVANRMGLAVAQQIAAQATGHAFPPLLPESVCHVLSSIEPDEQTRIDTSYRQRGDGFLLQQVKQTRNPNPAGEDVAWAEAMYRDFLRP